MPHRRAGEVFLKMGFAGSDTEAQAARLLGAAVTTARDAGPAGMVAVAYADWARAHAPAPLSVVDVAERTGAIGVLLDTFEKDGRDLFASMPLDARTLWIEGARAVGLRVAVAGSLGARGIARLGGAPPDVVGVRGAACEGGRLGCVSETRVRALRVAAETVGSATPAKRQMIAPLSLT